MPIAVTSSILTYYLIRKGKLKPSKRLGAFPKVFISSICGFMIGPFFYLDPQSSTKILNEFPDTDLAARFRKKHQDRSQNLEKEKGLGNDD